MEMIVFAALLVISAVSGVVAYRAQSSGRAACSQAISVLSTAAAILLLGFVIAPRMEEVYIGFGSELPAPTVWILNAARQMALRKIMVALNLVTTVIGGILLFAQYHKQPRHRNAARMCWLAAIVVLTSVLGTAGTALLLPMKQLLQDLS